jgi:hypothetical protein
LATSSSSIGHEERLRRQKEKLELELELERQRVASLQQQQQQQQDQGCCGTASNCLSKKQWMALGIIAVVLGVLAISAVAGICASGKCSGATKASARQAPNQPGAEETTTTSPVPTPPPRAESVLAFVNNITMSDQTLTYPSNAIPEERAVKWLIDEDLNAAADDEMAIRQRYALSTVWFLQTPTPFGTASHEETWATNIKECK